MVNFQEYSTKTVYAVIEPITILYRLLGIPTVATLIARKASEKLYYIWQLIEIFQTILIVGGYVYFYDDFNRRYTTTNGLNETKNVFLKLRFWCDLYILPLNNIFVFIFLRANRQWLNEILRKYEEIDKLIIYRLKYHNHQQRAHSNYNKNHEYFTKQIFMIKSLTIYISITLICYLIYLFSKENDYPLFTICQFYNLILYIVPNYNFLCYLYLTKYRYKYINDLICDKFMKQTDNNVDNTDFLVKKQIKVNSSITKTNKLKVYVKELPIIKVKQFENEDDTNRIFFDLIFEVHDILYEITQYINKSFGIIILIYIMVAFINALAFLYYNNPITNAERIEKYDIYEWIYNGIFTFVYFIFPYHVIIFTTNTSNAANYTKIILHRVRNLYDNIKDMVSEDS